MSDGNEVKVSSIATVVAVIVIGVVGYMFLKNQSGTSRQVGTPVGVKQGNTDLVGGGTKGTETNVWDFLGNIVSKVADKGFDYIVASQENSGGFTLVGGSDAYSEDSVI